MYEFYFEKHKLLGVVHSWQAIKLEAKFSKFHVNTVAGS
jgi:hypothetical protein